MTATTVFRCRAQRCAGGGRGFAAPRGDVAKAVPRKRSRLDQEGARAGQADERAGEVGDVDAGAGEDRGQNAGLGGRGCSSGGSVDVADGCGQLPEEVREENARFAGVVLRQRHFRNSLYKGDLSAEPFAEPVATLQK